MTMKILLKSRPIPTVSSVFASYVALFFGVVIFHEMDGAVADWMAILLTAILIVWVYKSATSMIVFFWSRAGSDE